LFDQLGDLSLAIGIAVATLRFEGPVVGQALLLDVFQCGLASINALLIDTARWPQRL
jgi:hypothetical protein